MDWVLCTERMPEDGQTVVICSWQDTDYSDEADMLDQWNNGCRYQYVAEWRGGKYKEWSVRFSTNNTNNSAYTSLSFRSFEDGSFPITHWAPLNPPTRKAP